MSHVVIDHHHDAEAGVYRLTIGIPQEVLRPVTDDDGNPIPQAVPLLDEHGEPQRDIDGKEIVLIGPPRLEPVVEHADIEDFAFADDDERWEGKSDEEVAKLQRAIVKDQLADREKQRAAQREAEAQRKSMPGSGKAL